MGETAALRAAAVRVCMGEVRGPRSRRYSEREEETRDRAERGSAVRGSDQASVAPKRIPSPTLAEMLVEARRPAAHYEEIIKLEVKKRVWITRLTGVVLFFTSVRLCLWYESTNGLILARDFFHKSP